jgi:hypothetical protein
VGSASQGAKGALMGGNMALLAVAEWGATPWRSQGLKN